MDTTIIPLSFPTCCPLPHHTWRYVRAYIFVCTCVLTWTCFLIPFSYYVLLGLISYFHPPLNTNTSLRIIIALTLNWPQASVVILWKVNRPISELLALLLWFLQVPPSSYNLQSDALHHLGWFPQCIHSLNYAVIFVNVCFPRLWDSGGEGTVPFLCFYS